MTSPRSPKNQFTVEVEFIEDNGERWKQILDLLEEATVDPASQLTEQTSPEGQLDHPGNPHLS